MNGLLLDTFNLALTGFQILLNGFFIAAEFALVKGNRSEIKSDLEAKNPLASKALYLRDRNSKVLLTCQMEIIMACLVLGLIAEQA